jgi:hypothetical protein
MNTFVNMTNSLIWVVRLTNNIDEVKVFSVANDRPTFIKQAIQYPWHLSKMGQNLVKIGPFLWIWPLTSIPWPLPDLTPSGTPSVELHESEKLGEDRIIGVGWEDGQTNKQTHKLTSNISMICSFNDEIYNNYTLERSWRIYNLLHVSCP